MRIEQLSLQNVRLFGNNTQSLTFEDDKNITILLGNNGCGKSTILDTISIMLSPFIGVFPGNSLKPLKILMFILMMIIVSQISCMQNLCSETMKTIMV